MVIDFLFVGVGEGLVTSVGNDALNIAHSFSIKSIYGYTKVPKVPLLEPSPQPDPKTKVATNLNVPPKSAYQGLPESPGHSALIPVSFVEIVLEFSAAVFPYLPAPSGYVCRSTVCGLPSWRPLLCKP